MQRNRIRYDKEYKEMIAARSTVDNSWNLNIYIVWAG